uniref:Uncharacterized protein n=1 Tax=Clastoptera arizonana TaxID=38151 RepID=A0A1B6CS26_9HEMI
MLMQKESNIFSQDFSEEVSLLTQSKSEENNEQATQAQTNNNGKINIIDSYIDTFCESSYKLGDIIISDLESIDKTKQKLTDNLNKTKAQLKEYMKIHEEQKNNIVQWQMEEEELSLAYQKEIDNRQELLDNTNYALDVTQILYEKHKSMTECINNIVEISDSDEIVLEKQYQLANQQMDKVNKKQNDYEKEMCLLQERFDNLEKEIKENDNTIVIKVNTKTIEVQALKEKISNMEQMIFLEKKKLYQNLEETKGLNFEIESVKQNKCELSNKLKEIQKKKVDLITNINAKINSEKNELTKLTFTYKKNEKHLTNLETELKHVQTNVKRIQLSIEETVQQEINDKNKIKMNRDKLEELYTKQTKFQEDIIKHEKLQSEIANLKLVIADKKN